MTISSVVLRATSEAAAADVVALVGEIGGCEVIASQGDKVVVLIETETFEQEIAVYKALERLSGVREAAMIYDYKDLSAERDAAENADIEKIVREMDEKDPSQIRYNGNPSV